MATDNSELSFVRCTSCRSLIPAVSTRCRMCGASVQSQVQEADSSENKRTTRIRQKTVAISNGLAGLQANEEESSKDNQSEISEDTPLNESSRVAGDTLISEEVDFEDDPISNYIQEIGDDSDSDSDENSDEDEESSEKSDQDNDVKDNEFKDEDTFDSDLEEENLVDDRIEAETSKDKNKLSNKSKEKVSSSVTPSELKSDAFSDKSVAKQFKVSASGTGFKIAGGKSKMVQEREVGYPENVSTKIDEESTADSNYFEEKRNNFSEVEDDYKNESSKDTVVAKSSMKESFKNDRELGFINKVSNLSEVSMEKEDKEDIENGIRKIFGWLVSYATPEGKAFEVRESKFFITNKALKQNDFIVSDRSVSTPHAMVHVTRSGGFLVQDLMSDRGMFIRRKGSDTYQREESIVKCSHGDWIRVGDVEYLLSIVGDVIK